MKRILCDGAVGHDVIESRIIADGARVLTCSWVADYDGKQYHATKHYCMDCFVDFVCRQLFENRTPFVNLHMQLETFTYGADERNAARS